MESVTISRQPRFSGFSHASLPCRDLEQSKRFYTQVLGGELVHDVKGFAEVRVAGVIVGLSEQPEGWTGGMPNTRITPSSSSRRISYR